MKKPEIFGSDNQEALDLERELEGSNDMKDRIKRPSLEALDKRNQEVLLCIESKSASTFAANMKGVGLDALQALRHHYPEGSDRHKLIMDEFKVRA